MKNLPVYKSYGLGVEGAAILLRWLSDPSSRDFDLSELTVITAQTGEEWDDTASDVTEHILPRLREHAVRYVQVARAGHREEDGIEVLDDTREPYVVYHQGAYKLSDELMLAGTVPQFGSVHTCSLKFKVFPIEFWLKDELAGRPYRHFFGYNADETSRIEKSEAATLARNALDRETPTGAHRMVFGFNADEIERIERGHAYDTPAIALRETSYGIPHFKNSEAAGGPFCPPEDLLRHPHGSGIRIGKKFGNPLDQQIRIEFQVSGCRLYGCRVSCGKRGQATFPAASLLLFIQSLLRPSN